MLSAGEMQRPRAQACWEIARATPAAVSTTPVHSQLEAEAEIEQPPHAFDSVRRTCGRSRSLISCKTRD